MGIILRYSGTNSEGRASFGAWLWPLTVRLLASSQQSYLQQSDCGRDHAVRLLRLRANAQHPLAAAYSITSSARASSVGVEAERFGGGQIDDEIELGRRLNGQVGGFLALEDAIDVTRSQPVLVDDIWPV